MTYDEFPIEQVARSVRSRFQRGFARLTMHMLPNLDDVAYEASIEGLRILATSESALRVPIEVVRQVHGNDVVIEPPRVRLAYRDVPCEPVMALRVSVDDRHVQAVVDDLAAREAKVAEIHRRHGRATVRATGRLRTLIGYPDAVACLTGGAADLVMWLVGYVDTLDVAAPAVAPGGASGRTQRNREARRRDYAAPGPLSASGR